jgi:hypothetical protein
MLRGTTSFQKYAKQKNTPIKKKGCVKIIAIFAAAVADNSH